MYPVYPGGAITSQLYVMLNRMDKIFTSKVSYVLEVVIRGSHLAY